MNDLNLNDVNSIDSAVSNSIIMDPVAGAARISKRKSILFEPDKMETNCIFNQFQIDLTSFTTSILEMNTTGEQTDTIFKSCLTLLNKFSAMLNQLNVANTGFETRDTIDIAFEFASKHLSKFTTTSKRATEFKSLETYVEPKTLALGTHWEVRRVDEEYAIPRLLQSTFQYIPILETLCTLFNDKSFRDAYSQFNHSSHKHECKPGVFEDICCGSTFQKNLLFAERPDSIRIVIAADDTEICNPIGSKATIHKVTAIYMSILNLPKAMRSKLQNIYLVGLITTDDLKTKETEFNDIWRIVVNELNHLETSGIHVDSIGNLRGALVACIFDNAGAATALGFVESFNTKYSCRICEIEMDERQVACKENKSLYRSKDKYAEAVAIIENSENVDYIATKGVKRYCVLNDLSYYHILDNIFLDPMHDLFEGILRDLLKYVFDHCIANRIFSECWLKNQIQFFNYGRLNRKNRPSNIMRDKANLNQSASQIRCLLMHLPFILYEFRQNEALQAIWICVESIMRISQILSSDILCDGDLARLDEHVSVYLESIKKNFSHKFKPKDHHLTHYASVIRAMGPLRNLRMDRYENKHQEIKSAAKKTRNFKNILKSIASKHQKKLSLGSLFVGGVICSRKIKEVDTSKFSYGLDLPETILELDWFQFNEFHYTKKLLIVSAGRLFKIEHCFVEDNKQFLICKMLLFQRHEKFSNSFVFAETSPAIFKLIDFSDLESKCVYESKHVNDEMHVISENLSLNFFTEK